MSKLEDDLALIRRVLGALHEEVLHPGYLRDLGLDVNVAYEKAMAAWERVRREATEAAP